MRVAVLGAGIQGACAALELARRGCHVDLFDRARSPVSEASRWNEGKLHLGLIFAKDRASRTARTMTLGSLHFAAGLSRWGIDGLEDHLSEPFTYVVHRDSMLEVDQVEAHFRAVAGEYLALRDELGLTYLGNGSRALFERVDPAQLGEHYDEDHAVAAFRTVERSIDPERVAEGLRAAVAAEAPIRFLGERSVGGVEPGDGGWAVRSRAAGAGDEARELESHTGYAHVVNALWRDRLRVDAALGLAPGRDWLFRYKLALHVAPPASYASPPPSTTLMLGPFGDIVNFGGRRLYLSWYPVCRLASSSELVPPDTGSEVTAALRERVFRTTLEELARIVPALGSLDVNYGDTRVEGGVIFTWGSREITDPASELHRRYDIGVHSTGSYHSVDTGKYCMAPYFALLLAERIRPAG